MRSKDRIILAEKEKEEALLSLFRGVFPEAHKRNYDMWVGFQAGYRLGLSFKRNKE